jgi:hypothetical protein
MSNFSKLLWVRYVGRPEDSKPLLVGIREGVDKTYMHWSAGDSYTTWNPDEFAVVKEFEYSGYDSIDEAESELNKTYAPKPQQPSARLGWISPNGEWYPCGYCCHWDLEALLAEVHYGSSHKQLENFGWVSVKGGALIGVREEKHPISEDTKNTLRKVVEEFELAESLNPDINWDSVLLANLEGYREQSWFTRPSEFYSLDKGNTYAQELRDSYEVYFGDYHKKVAPLITPATRVRRVGEHPGD